MEPVLFESAPFLFLSENIVATWGQVAIPILPTLFPRLSGGEVVLDLPKYEEPIL